MVDLDQTRVPDNESIVGGNKPPKKIKVKKQWLLIGGGIAVLVFGVAIGLLISSSMNKKASDTDDKGTIKPVKYSETVTPNAYGNFLSVALKGFYLGGNTNGVDIPAHNHYPSVADLKNREWTKQNMQLDDRMHELITSGEVVYEPKGCKADQPSSEQNKCSDFIVKSADKVLFDSTKED